MVIFPFFRFQAGHTVALNIFRHTVVLIVFRHVTVVRVGILSFVNFKA